MRIAQLDLIDLSIDMLISLDEVLLLLSNLHQQNMDARTRTVRLRPPKNTAFSISGFQQSTRLAGGLETFFEVGHELTAI